jgi:hypothetical protein
MTDSTTTAGLQGKGLSDDARRLETASWAELTGVLASDLDASAKASGALVRRRGIQSAQDLLRMIFAYAICDCSLRLVGAWLVISGLADISDVAILRRLRHSQRWLGQLIVALLGRRQVCLAAQPGVHLRIVDATQIFDGQRAHWYVHACFDLGQMCLAGVAVTDAHSGESLVRFPGQAGEILLADRGYAHAKGLGASLAHGAHLVVRCHWQNLVLQEDGGQHVDLLAWLTASAGSSFSQPSERQLWLSTAQGRFALRLVTAALPPAAAERARQRVRTKAQLRGRTPSQANLWAAGFILVLTNLPPDGWSSQQVLDLYRLRWQVELLFKRHKSLFNLDGLRAHDPQLVQTYLLAKLLAALWLEDLVQDVATTVPDWFSTLERPVSLWRLTQCLWTQLQRTVQGTIHGSQIRAALLRLRRFLCDAPRQRQQQLAVARALLARLSTCISACAEP